MAKELSNPLSWLAVALLIIGVDAAAEERQLLFGDTHLHTAYSFDAYLNRNQTATPGVAYRWAKGEPVIHPLNRTRVQIETPLDFLAVTDHAELMGFIRAVNLGTDQLQDLGWWGNLKRWFTLYVINDAIESASGAKIFTSFLPVTPQPGRGDPVKDPGNVLDASVFGDTGSIETSAWQEIVNYAEQHNQPGKFTTLIGWEWSSLPVGANLHRIVFTPDGADIAQQFLPYGSDDSQYPEDLWTFLEATNERTGARFIAMPHNSNISRGYMYDEKTLKGEPLTAEYARRRMKWEPISEITQYKGDSETHPELSPEDEFADYESYPYYIMQEALPYEVRAADYMRSALKTGLTLERGIGVNPYQFGIIGSTDSHSGLAAAEEDNFWGKFARDSTPETKVNEDRIGGSDANGWSMQAGGLAAVWARENTREAIFEAFQSRETYATTGTRLKIRVFGGWEFPEDLASRADYAAIGYAQGVPMGGELPAASDAGIAPQFMIHAEKDPVHANLDRLQVVKGWLGASGEAYEQVYDVAWAGDRTIGVNGRLPAIGNTVDVSTGRWDNSIGEPRLSALWTDPDFDPQQPAFYYVRVLQIPTPRHSLLDALALGTEPTDDGPATLQERAYSSPIWYSP